MVIKTGVLMIDSRCKPLQAPVSRASCTTNHRF